MANISDLNYTTIENSYNDNLVRKNSDYPDILKSSILEFEPVNGIANNAYFDNLNKFDDPINDKINNEFNNIWIKNWIKSRNYTPKIKGFYLDGKTGYAEFSIITTGDLMTLKGNDIYLYDATTGGTNPVKGNAASIVFPRTDDDTQRFVMQKRAGYNDDDENVMEMFFDKNANNSESNYIFIGKKGDEGVNESKTDIIQFASIGRFEFTLSNGWDAVAGGSAPCLGMYNTENIGLDSGGTLLGFQVNLSDSDAGFTDGASIGFTILDNGSATSGRTFIIIDKNGINLVSDDQTQSGILGVDDTTGELQWNGVDIS